MVVPALFRWLSRKYPRFVEQVFEDEPIGSQVDGGEQPTRMMAKVFRYTNQVVNMVRPRKLLMIAIDCPNSVSPSAKLNQQLSFWFRAAQEANAITPGTPFMKLQTDSLRHWIFHKLNTNPGWKQIQVIFSDSSIPGQGEHKFMEFICRSRTQPSYNPNTIHVIYGLDSDLIMLSLATHEPHFKSLREDVFSDERRRKGCHLCGQPSHHSSQCQGKPKERANEFDVKLKLMDRKPFIFLNVSTLRDYIAIELNMVGTSFKFELKRAINNWVLLILFIGNNFLPHLLICKTNLARTGQYLTDCGQLNLSYTEIILQGLAAREEDIFRKG
ncbi:XRN 5'-3' exonuclease N-terminus-domain-containing protein [Phakopsora pachyrhizi]|uniref:XRN 5'-3' exonuclease N-terminus-domain-containing protein n=1 Tax=Phakopsora pachyrhizi TaxID=170000 RepID=A0AAV0BK61_PHAPC|nr:XRN 5'-3' exonuclease N-terminus-domain-containing protein [Phakopsora pachyrhizi]